MKNKIITLLLIGAIITPNFSYAQIPVGGRIMMTHECLCSGGWMFYVLDLYAGSVVPVLFQFGASRLNANYNIFTPGVQTLGSYTIGATCLMVSLECAGGPQPAGSVSPWGMPGIGTSLLPG